MNKALIADDDEIVRFMLSEKLSEHGFAVVQACDGKEAVAAFREEEPDVVLLDLKMPGMDGIETLHEIKRLNAEVPVIIVTAHGDIPTAVQAIKKGAYDFIEKPPRISKLIVTLERALEKGELERRLKRLATTVETSLEWLMGRSKAMKGIIDQIKQVSWSDLSVLLQGETGTGKTFLANAIHNFSRRAKGEFVRVDIGVIPETLVESELFGHERGAFTGAERKKQGYFERAHRGTIFIDELENISPAIQGKLLGAVEEKKVYPLGNGRPVAIDVRIITATNSDIAESVRERRFREDLFFRLGEFVITLPPLRERVDDIPFLARKFLIEAATEVNRPVRDIHEGALEYLACHHWPGNIRELKNVIRRAVLLSGEDTLMEKHIELLIRHNDAKEIPSQLFPLRSAVMEVERAAIQQALHLKKGNRTKAASLLQVDYKTLISKMRDYGIG